MPVDESYHDDLELLIERAEASVASILIAMLMPQVAVSGMQSALTAAGAFSMRSAVDLLSKSKKATKLAESISLVVTPAVIGSIDLLRNNVVVSNAYGIAKDAVEAVVDKASEYYDGKELDSTTSLKDSATKTARWLVRAAVFEGQEDAAVKLGRTRKRWVSRHDSRVRFTHRTLDGQTVDIDKRFKSQSGATLMYPGDVTAPLNEVINCRCSVEFV